MKKVEVDSGAGFCFGVDQVIKTAEDHLREGTILYGLGEMVHNSEEVLRLEAMGLKTINHNELGEIKSGKVLLRAHGEPPATYQLAREHDIEIIDGTCPIVTRLQIKIRKVYTKMDRDRQQLVIFGKSDHPETIGILGQVDGDATVVNSMEDIDSLDPTKGILLFSQTTMDPELYKEVEEWLKDHLQQPDGLKEGGQLQSDCTICGQMKRRKPVLAAFAKDYDLVLFVSGKNSSNGKMLYEYCRSVNPITYWVSGIDDIDPSWFKEVESIGISGATSTSMDQLQAVKDRVKMLSSSYDR
ncbi:MAG: 4-hydroxy-3-methylbut-2-enyl diphosphate reductase [Bacteroidales bacterium]|nr:4-hydroxy-3-methylbut-2-enyl diphosphate reductase [Bacteroidales bacterium]